MLFLARFSVQWDNRKIQDPVVNSLLSVEYLIPYGTLNGVKQLVLFVTVLLMSKGFPTEPSAGLSPGSQAAPGAAAGPGSSPVAVRCHLGCRREREPARPGTHLSVVFVDGELTLPGS